MAVTDYDPIIEAASREWDVDPNWVRSIMQHESGGNAMRNGKPIVGSSGERGLMQIMPKTAAGLGLQNPDDPVENIWGGVKYLAQMRDQFHGNVSHATAAYNAGPERVNEFLTNGRALPDSTVKTYLPSVSGHYQGFAKQYQARPAQAAGDRAAQPGGDLSNDDFLKMTGGVPAAAPAVPSNDDFLKMIGVPAASAAAPAAGLSEPADTQMTSAQMAESRARAAQGPYASLEPAEPGFAHLAWTVGQPVGAIFDALHGNAPIPEGAQTSGLQMAGALAAPGLRFGDNPLVARPMARANPLAADVAPGGAVRNPLSAPNPLASQTVIPAPAFIPPGAQVPVLPRINALLAEDQRIAASRPTEIPPTAAVDPLTGRAVPVQQPANPLTSAATVPYAAPAAPKPLTVAASTAPIPLTYGPIPTTSAAAKTIASNLYARADSSGGQLAPGFTNRFLDRAQALAPQTAEGQAVAGNNELTALTQRMQALRDQPISLQGAQEIDESLGNLIDKEYGPKGLTKDGKNIADLQTAFRDMIRTAKPDDIVGGAGGFDALSAARQAWAQAAKMSDLERIATRASMTDNPATGIKSGIRTLLSNPARARGYSPEEIAALKSAGERGLIGGALHVFGSRLMPLIAGGAGLGAEGPMSAMMAAGATHLGSSVLRNSASALQAQRLNNALRVLGSRVPLQSP